MTPLNRGRFYGDDFQTIQSITTPGGYRNFFFNSLALAGLDKWRPFFSFGIGPIYRLFGENYSNFQIFSTILLSFVGYLSYSLIQELFNSKITGFENVYAFILPALIASSRFTWMMSRVCCRFGAVSIMWLEGCRKGDCCYGTSIEVHIGVAASSH